MGWPVTQRRRGKARSPVVHRNAGVRSRVAGRSTPLPVVSPPRKRWRVWLAPVRAGVWVGRGGRASGFAHGRHLVWAVSGQFPTRGARSLTEAGGPGGSGGEMIDGV